MSRIKTKPLPSQVVFEQLEEGTVWLNYQGKPERFYELPEFYQDAIGVNAMADGEIIATLAQDTRGFIYHLYVVPAYRGQGLLRQLMAYYEGSSETLDGEWVSEDLRDKLEEILEELHSPDPFA